MSFLLTLSPEANALRESLRQQILTLCAGLPNRDAFQSLALDVFRYQATYNPVYASYLHHLTVQPSQITDLRQIPFMPIGFFKSHTVLTAAGTDVVDTLTFASSGTTGENTSRHVVPDSELYDAVCTQIFEQTYGPLRNFHYGR